MIATLARVQRPVVQFDPNNFDHRMMFKKFLDTNTWGWCPVRFFLDEDQYSNVVDMCHDKILKYYFHLDRKMLDTFNKTKPTTETL